MSVIEALSMCLKAFRETRLYLLCPILGKIALPILQNRVR